MKKIIYNNKILLLGLGSIAKGLLQILERHLELNPNNFIILDANQDLDSIDIPWVKHCNYIKKHLTPSNYQEVLNTLISQGDLVINLTSGVDSLELMSWCNRNNILYIDTSLEPWAEHYRLESIGDELRTYYFAHDQAKELSRSWKKDSSTCLTTHGANPGIVNYFVKAAIILLATKLNLSFKIPETREHWAELCMLTGTKVIHISETDTQKTNKIKPPNEFWNTWSIPSFRGELLASPEIGWGTHEKTLPENALEFSKGQKNSIFLKQMSAKTLVKSWGPLSGSFVGFLVPHSETITLSNYFTVYKNGKVIYRPTVLFAYKPSYFAIQSFDEILQNNSELHPKLKILNKEIVTGYDELGALLLGHPKNALWYGSELSIEDARKNFPDQNATTVQVVSGLISGISWVLRNPQQGYCEPENLPYEEILKIAEPYLKPIISSFSDWKPIDSTSDPKEDIWQIKNFLVYDS